MVLSLLCQISIATGFFRIRNCEWSRRNIKDVSCIVVPGPGGSLAAELKGDVPIIGINSYFAAANEYTSQLLEQICCKQ